MANTHCRPLFMKHVFPRFLNIYRNIAQAANPCNFGGSESELLSSDLDSDLNFVGWFHIKQWLTE